MVQRVAAVEATLGKGGEVVGVAFEEEVGVAATAETEALQVKAAAGYGRWVGCGSCPTHLQRSTCSCERRQ